MAATTPSHSTVNLLSLNLDVLSEVVSFLSPRDAHRLALTSRESYSLAIRRALSTVVVDDVFQARSFYKCVLSYVPEKLLLIQDLRFVGFVEADEEHAPLLGDLLMQTRNLKCLHLEDSEQLLFIEPRIGEAIAALPNIVELKLTEGGDTTARLMSDLRSRPLRLVHSSFECWTDHTPLFTSPALRELEVLTLSCFDDDECAISINYLPFLAIRVLELTEWYMPMDICVAAFPNIRTLSMDDVAASGEPIEDSPPHSSCWPSLDHVRSVYHGKDLWTVTCPVHHLELRPPEEQNSKGTAESEAANILRAVEDMSPVVLTMELDVGHGPELWLPLVTVVPRLVCLIVTLRLERLLGTPFLTWIETVPPILASLRITCLKVRVEGVSHILQHRSSMPSMSTGEPGTFDFFRAVAQILPATLAKSLPSLTYLSFATLERYTSGTTDYITRESETNAWWRLAETEGKRVMEPFSTSDGEDLLERLRSEPGAENAILQA